MLLKSYEIEGSIRITELVKSSQFHFTGCDIDRMEIPSNTKMKRHFHRSFDEVFYVQSGEGIAQVGEREFLIQTGDLFLALNGEFHAVNTKDAELSILTVCLPFFDGTDIVYEG